MDKQSSLGILACRITLLAGGVAFGLGLGSTSATDLFSRITLGVVLGIIGIASIWLGGSLIKLKS